MSEPNHSDRRDLRMDMIPKDRLCYNMIEDIKRTIKPMPTLTEQVEDASAAMWKAFEGIGKAMEHFRPKSDELLREVKAFSGSATFELTKTLQALHDLRKIMTSPDHEKEMAKLREFLELCEKFKKMKEEGMLDAVCDTLLKL